MHCKKVSSFAYYNLMQPEKALCLLFDEAHNICQAYVFLLLERGTSAIEKNLRSTRTKLEKHED